MADPDPSERAATDDAIAAHLLALGTELALPDAALRACVARFGEAAQPLRALLDRAAAGKSLSEEESLRCFRGLHVLAAVRDTDSFPSLLRLLHRPADEVDALLGDAVTETLPRLLISLFDGDADALLAVVADPTSDDVARSAALDAAAYLAWQRRLDVASLRRCLVDLYEARAAEDLAVVWFAWMQAVAHLDLRDLVPMVEAAWKGGRIDRAIQEWSDFKTDLARARTAYDDERRFGSLVVGVVDDVVAELEWTRHWANEEPNGAQTGELDLEPGSTPVINPFRGVGRNDPCPCGSGRKAKKCCLANA